MPVVALVARGLDFRTSGPRVRVEGAERFRTIPEGGLGQMRRGARVPVAFLSYAGSQRPEAHRIRGALEQRGIAVIMDANFPIGEAILVNIGNAALSSDVVVALISSEYLDRHWTEVEVSTAIATSDVRFLPLLHEGAQPAPSTDRGRSIWGVLSARSYMPIDYSEDAFNRLADEIKRVARADTSPVDLLGDAGHAEGLAVALLYDWEDGNLVDDAAQKCATAGIAVENIGSAGVPLPGDLAESADILILWTWAAKASPDIGDAIMNAVAAKRQVIYLVQPEGPPAPGSARVLTFGALAAAPDRPSVRPEVRWSRDKPQLRLQVEKSVELNSNVPFHLIGDKFCASRESAAAAANAYEMGVNQFKVFDETRLEAVLGHAAAQRFRGDWQQAAELLAREPLPDSDVPPQPSALAVAAERLSLEFELGRMSDITSRATTVLQRALAAGEWPLIIAAHRQLGMIREERGDYRLARDHLDRASHYAEDLLDTPSLAERLTTNQARRALRADSLRELASVEWRDGDVELARDHLDQASDVLDPVRDNPAAGYLLSVIAAQRGRIAYANDHDYETARNMLRQSYQDLQKYDNPVRLANVLESLVQLEMDFIRGDDEAIAALRPTLEKVRRVRHVRGHDYMIAKTTRALGDLEFALGNYEAAKDQYIEARDEFNRLGKHPETATTLRYLSRCLSRLGDSEGAIEMLVWALEQLQEPDHHATLAEIRSEMARLRHRRPAPDQITNQTEMTEVGEFAVHEWIAGDLLKSRLVTADHVIVGVGDDGAVLRPGADEDLVLTTDSVPPSLLTDDSQQAASYAARFGVVTALADVIAMGAEPTAVLLNLHLRRTTTASWTRAFLESSAQESARYGAVVVGGDLRERGQKVLTVTGVGRIRQGRAITRAGAKSGDIVALTLSSSPGQEFIGLGTRWALELARHLSGAEASLLAALAHRDAIFTDLGLPHQVMRAIAGAGLATSAIDTSDGLLACAELIGNASNVGIEFFPEEIGRLINADVSELARRLAIAPFIFAFAAGYDWEVMLTVPGSRDAELRALSDSAAASSNQRVAVIGRVVQRQPWAADGVRLRVPGGRPVHLPYFTGEKFLPQPYLLRARGWLEFAKQSTRRIPSEVSGMSRE